MSSELLSREVARENVDKIKVSSAEIVVHGTKQKPYFEIKYFDLSDNDFHIGFSSYDLNIVFEYLGNFFEIVNNKSNFENQCKEFENDLISRKSLIENLNKFAPEHYTALINDLITKEPASFDKEKVIEDLNDRMKDAGKWAAKYDEVGDTDNMDL